MIFGRVKSLDAILATAEKKSLHRSLGAFQLTMLGIGAVIGTGIFVLTAEAAQKAGPGMMVSFIIAGFVRAVGTVARDAGMVADGYRLLANVGAHGGQEVPHLHVHVFAGRPLGPMLAR